MPRRIPTECVPWLREQVNRYERPLVAYATRILGDPERARDVVQDVFLRLFEQPRADVEPRLSEWLYTVTRNRSIDLLRKEHGMSQRTDEDVATLATPNADPAREPGVADLHERVLAEIDRLPDRQREVIHLRFHGGLSYREIAAVTALSVTNVGFLLSTGLRALREVLGPERVEELAS